MFGQDHIVNHNKPFKVPEGKESHAHYILAGQKSRLVIVADKKTLMNNPFDLCQEDFKYAMELPTEKVIPLGKALEYKTGE